MIEPRFAINAIIYREIVAALKPHLSRDDIRPVLAGVRVRYSGGQATLEATDGYSALRVQAMADDALLADDTTPIDVVVPGADLLSIKPHGKDSTITFIVEREDVVDLDTGEIGEPGVSTISDGITTVRLGHIVLPAQYPDFDKITGDMGRVGKGADSLLLNPALLGRLAKLPGVVKWRSIGEGRPIFFYSDGEGRQDHSPAEYQGVIMPVRNDGEEAPTWQDWTP